MMGEFIELVLISIVTASTPLLLASLGELVAERAGVLNLGVEGMMIMGAICGFIGAYETGSSLLGAVAGILAGMALAAVFAVLTVLFAINQVAAGLALTISGIGLSGLIGTAFIGLKRDSAPHLAIPGLSDLPFVGNLLFGEDFFVYATILLTIGVAWFLKKSRAGLTLRGVGENHAAAHALGLNVAGWRMAAVLFGGGCAGLAGAYLSLAYTPFWSPNMTAGRGWIALALVVFASWRPWRAMAGALLFGSASILQLHAQAFSIGLPGQLLSALPYLATIVALILLSLQNRGVGRAPACLGQPFVPDR